MSDKTYSSINGTFVVRFDRLNYIRITLNLIFSKCIGKHTLFPSILFIFLNSFGDGSLQFAEAEGTLCCVPWSAGGGIGFKCQLVLAETAFPSVYCKCGQKLRVAGTGKCRFQQTLSPTSCRWCQPGVQKLMLGAESNHGCFKYRWLPQSAGGATTSSWQKWFVDFVGWRHIRTFLWRLELQPPDWFFWQTKRWRLVTGNFLHQLTVFAR